MVSPDIRPQISPWAFLVNRAYFRCSYYLHYWAKNGFFLRRIKYPVTKKCFNDIIPKIKRGLYQINRYKPRVNINLLYQLLNQLHPTAY